MIQSVLGLIETKTILPPNPTPLLRMSVWSGAMFGFSKLAYFWERQRVLPPMGYSQNSVDSFFCYRLYW